ncbi:DUF418 domain-containing protein [Billgrantia antri]|uniref:DUF418 domain-containing protein n=1 Tax=Billgrantia antri TaxID=2846777 RepID=A0ABS6ZTP8_9GAMM|nr:DUF418 domain-containing protein [Halomonas antri]MBW6393431.1 DUF418 domain-containing protein [Halomonas antri]
MRDRIEALDMLRGMALLGILIMNVQAFAMPQAAYMNPTAWGRLEGIDLVAWLVSHLFADQKMMALFSMLFGAGIVLFTERAEAAGRPAVALHFRRQSWLLLFGVVHAYLIWYGDVLFTYAVCGMLLYPCRRLSPAVQLMLGLALLAVASAIFLLLGGTMTAWPEAERLALQVEWHPPAEQLQAEIERHRSGWLEQLPYRAEMAFEMQTFTLLVWGLWRAAGLMLIGMALYRLGVLTGQANRRVYMAMLAAALILGLPVVVYGIFWNFANDWGPHSLFFGAQYNHWGSVPVSLGWVACVMLALKAAWFPGLARKLAAVGRTAFSQYILQSVLCSLIFQGYGLGWFGRVERSEQLVIVLALWLLQLWLAPLWMRHFQYGPLEWLWRSLTYQRAQPFKR